MSEFKVGDEVIWFRGGWSDQFSKEKVNKVHKNGNFTLEKDSQQYRQSGYATGDSYNRSSVKHYTPELWEEREKPLRIKKKKHILRGLVEEIEDEGVLDSVIGLIKVDKT